MSDFNDISRMDLSKLNRAGYHPEDDEDIDDDNYTETDGNAEADDNTEADGNTLMNEGKDAEADADASTELHTDVDADSTGSDHAVITVDGEEVEVVPEEETTQGSGFGNKKKQHMAAPTGKHYYIDAHITPKEMTEFLFVHNYTSPLMVLATLIGLVWPIYTVIKANGSVLFACICALVFLVLMPVSIWRRGTTSVKQNPIYENTFHYMIDEAGLHVELAEHAADVSWSQVTRKLCLKTCAVLYTGKVNAYLIPTVAMGDQKDEIIRFIKEH